MAAERETIEGTVRDIIYRNEENGYTVAVLETDEKKTGEDGVTVVGKLLRCFAGLRLSLTGSVKYHPVYGAQFAITSAEERSPASREELFAFLSSGVIHGVGPSTAEALLKHFGEDVLHILDEAPERLREVRGIGEKTAEKIAASYREQRDFAAISLKFQSYGLSTAQGLRLFYAYGTEALSLIEENPYRLPEEVPGFGFRKADSLAAKFGVPADSPLRARAGLTYVLREAAGMEGNVFLPKEELMERTRDLLALPEEVLEDELIRMAVDGIIKWETLSGQDVCYLHRYFAAEQNTAAGLLRLLQAPLKTLEGDISALLNAAETGKNRTLSAQQKRAVVQSVAHGVSVITGGPGTGKTTIIETLLFIFEKCGLSVALAAPTGRAARRITEASGHAASTIHRLLEYGFSGDDQMMFFGKNTQDPLEKDVVIIDEASMVDLLLMEALLDALKGGTRLLLIGDSDQLSPVGAGNVLRDIIASECLYVTKLTEIFRQAQESRIVVNAHRINEGEYPFLNDRDGDFFFLPRQGEDKMARLIADLVTRRLPGGFDGIRDAQDIQVLTPLHRGKVGTEALNALLQEKLNPPAPGKTEKKSGKRIFRTGDRVMQMKNNYRLRWRRLQDMEEGDGVFNGDVGVIRSIDLKERTLSVLYDGDRLVTYGFEQLEELELAYAITVHKSQGSEFPAVILPVSYFPEPLATRNLLYTAITRAKKLAVLCGSLPRMQAMVDNDRMKERYSGLAIRLENLRDMGLLADREHPYGNHETGDKKDVIDAKDPA